MQLGYLLALVSLVLHILDRQVEYTSRTDILWKSKLRVEQDEVETMRGINKILLENILPAHVADHFLATRATQVNSLNFYLDRIYFHCDIRWINVVLFKETIIWLWTDAS